MTIVKAMTKVLKINDGIIVEKWTKPKKHRLLKCVWKLKYNRIISSFYLDDLKKEKENYLGGLLLFLQLHLDLQWQIVLMKKIIHFNHLNYLLIHA